jgi:hypothetical protein
MGREITLHRLVAGVEGGCPLPPLFFALVFSWFYTPHYPIDSPPRGGKTIYTHYRFVVRVVPTEQPVD